MKRVSKLIYILVALCGVSCDSYLDINNNPNSPTNASANLILPNALVATANVLNGYNSYGAQIGGIMANAGGYGGFNELITYQYTSGTYNVWSGAYDNMEDYQYIINKVGAEMAKGDSSNVYYYAAAMIMRAYDFQLVVDAYNDAPYTNALKGSANVTPSYDAAATIYKDLGDDLDNAIQLLNRGDAMIVKNALTAPIDNNSSLLWHQFANTLKLKLMVRGNGKVTFSKTTFDNVGFLTSEFSVNPGYKRDNGKQNPKWNTWGFSYTLTSGAKSWIPTKYVMAFYDGTTLSDAGRGKAMYYQFPGTGTNQLGQEGVNIPKCPGGSFWYPGADRTVAPGSSTGALKGPSASYPFMIAAESYFLQAEAVQRGIITSSSTPATLFNAGVTASFRYAYTLENGSVSGSPTTDASTYQFTTNNNKLTNYTKATTLDEQIQAIITQKYIALNMVHSQECWNEYQRTGYPASATSNMTPTNSFASLTSQSPNADKLPARIPYPASEVAYNPANVPSGIDKFTSKIFWAK